jgi:twitching motility protein PilT
MNPEDRLFGQVAIKLGYMSRESANHCLKVQTTERQGARFGQVARELKLIDDQQFAQAEQHVQTILEQRRTASTEVKRTPDPPPVSAVSPVTARDTLTASVPAWAVPLPPLAPGSAPVPVLLPVEEAPPVEPAAALSIPAAAPAPTPSLNAPAREHGTVSLKPAPAAPVPVPAFAPAPVALVDAPARAQVVVRPRPIQGQPPFLVQVLSEAAKRGASDLHLHSGAPLLARIHGRLSPFKGEQIISAQEAERYISEVLSDTEWALLTEKGEVDFAYAFPGCGRFRVNAYRQQRGMDIVFRIIAEEVPTIAQLGLPEAIGKLVDYRTGLVLCTGPSGCGKSTTLAALLRHLIDTREEHVLTIENPIEYVFKEKCSIVNQRQVGDHTSSFARALRAALREDPDVIAITEMRDRESIGLALSAAETGHLVLGTLHTGNAGQTISRIVNTFDAEEQGHIRTQLSESLRAVVSQRLVPKADGSGRALAWELLFCNTAVANMIRDDKMFQISSIMQTGKALGMVTLDDSLADLVTRNVVTKDEARRFAENKDRFR